MLRDLSLVAVKVGGQPGLLRPIDERLRHSAEVAVDFKSSITITQQAIHDTPGVSWADEQKTQGGMRSAQHQNPR